MDWVGILFTVLAAVLAVGIVAGVVVWRYVQKKRGKGGCDCCPGGCRGCHAAKKEDEKH